MQEIIFSMKHLFLHALKKSPKRMRHEDVWIRFTFFITNGISLMALHTKILLQSV